MTMPGMTELLIIGGIIFFLFGAKRLPQFGSAIGETVRNLRWSAKEVQSLVDDEEERG